MITNCVILFVNNNVFVLIDKYTNTQCLNWKNKCKGISKIKKGTLLSPNIIS